MRIFAVRRDQTAAERAWKKERKIRIKMEGQGKLGEANSGSVECL